jgi:hypothetical protein
MTPRPIRAAACPAEAAIAAALPGGEAPRGCAPRPFGGCGAAPPVL